MTTLTTTIITTASLSPLTQQIIASSSSPPPPPLSSIPPLSTVHIRLATSADVPHLSAVELSAASRFRSVPGLAYLADHPPLKHSFLTTLAHGHDYRLLLACASTSAASPILAFLAAFPHDCFLFIAEMSVASTAQAQGIGTALLSAAMVEAKALGLAGVSLTTYKKVAFNGPWYSKRGFHFVPAEQLGPCHVDGLANEIRLGLCKTGWERSCMVKWV